jgi:hypothetical protein
MNFLNPSIAKPRIKSALFLIIAASAFSASTQAESDHRLAFAILGDGEPKPFAEFPNMSAAVDQINALAREQPLRFVAGIGDIPHKGTVIQYEAATEVFKNLELPFYTIMGNEEHGGSVDRYLEYFALWNEGKTDLLDTKYVLEFDEVALVFASADHGRDFNASGIAWILDRMEELSQKPILLFVHGAQLGVYPERADKGITHPDFAKVVARKNLAAVISGDLHMDMDRVDHSKQIGHVHYLHIPALERTKVPDESKHTPMFRTVTIREDRMVDVATYEVGVDQPLERHAYQFTLPTL